MVLGGGLVALIIVGGEVVRFGSGVGRCRWVWDEGGEMVGGLGEGEVDFGDRLVGEMN